MTKSIFDHHKDIICDEMVNVVKKKSVELTPIYICGVHVYIQV